MSEQNTSNPKTIATGTKVKDPRRVAAGKKLGKMSNQYKETKRLKQETQQNAEWRLVTIKLYISSADYSW